MVLTFVPEGTAAVDLLDALSLTHDTAVFEWADYDAGDWVTNAARSAGLISWSVVYGRRDTASRTQPIQVTVTIAASSGACPQVADRVRLRISDAVASALGIDDDAAVRFTGEVTDPTMSPASGTYSVIMVGRLARSLRRPIDGTGWPRERDGARIGRVLFAAGAVAGELDGGTMALAPPVDATLTAGALIDLTTDSAAGLLVEQRNGSSDWQDRGHRRAAPVVVELSSAQILNTLQWTQVGGDVINQAAVTIADGTVVTVTDDDSVAARDLYPTAMNTALVRPADARAIGTLVVARRAVPVWQLPGLVVDLARAVSPAQLAALLSLEVGDLIRLTDLPAGHAYTGTVDLFVEGTTEALKRTSWQLTLSVSDPAYSGAPIRWADVTSGIAWEDVTSGLSWLDAARITDPADLT